MLQKKQAETTTATRTRCKIRSCRHSHAGVVCEVCGCTDWTPVTYTLDGIRKEGKKKQKPVQAKTNAARVKKEAAGQPDKKTQGKLSKKSDVNNNNNNFPPVSSSPLPNVDHKDAAEEQPAAEAATVPEKQTRTTKRTAKINIPKELKEPMAAAVEKAGNEIARDLLRPIRIREYRDGHVAVFDSGKVSEPDNKGYADIIIISGQTDNKKERIWIGANPHPKTGEKGPCPVCGTETQYAGSEIPHFDSPQDPQYVAYVLALGDANPFANITEMYQAQQNRDSIPWVNAPSNIDKITALDIVQNYSDAIVQQKEVEQQIPGLEGVKTKVPACGLCNSTALEWTRRVIHCGKPSELNPEWPAEENQYTDGLHNLGFMQCASCHSFNVTDKAYLRVPMPVSHSGTGPFQQVSAAATVEGPTVTVEEVYEAIKNAPKAAGQVFDAAFYKTRALEAKSRIDAALKHPVIEFVLPYEVAKGVFHGPDGVMVELGTTDSGLNFKLLTLPEKYIERAGSCCNGSNGNQEDDNNKEKEDSATKEELKVLRQELKAAHTNIAALKAEIIDKDSRLEDADKTIAQQSENHTKILTELEDLRRKVDEPIKEALKDVPTDEQIKERAKAIAASMFASERQKLEAIASRATTEATKLQAELNSTKAELTTTKMELANANSGTATLELSGAPLSQAKDYIIKGASKLKLSGAGGSVQVVAKVSGQMAGVPY